MIIDRGRRRPRRSDRRPRAEPAEVTRAHLDRIAAVDEDVHAFLYVDEARALAAADMVDARIAAGESVGPLAGVPLALKDVFTYAGAPTTCGSRILQNWWPPYSATVTQRLLDAGIVILGKTNMDEFAMGSSTENSAFGPTHDPWTWNESPVDRAGVLGRARPRTRHHWRSGPIPGARSGSRRRSPERWG